MPSILLQHQMVQRQLHAFDRLPTFVVLDEAWATECASLESDTRSCDGLTPVVLCFCELPAAPAPPVLRLLVHSQPAQLNIRRFPLFFFPERRILWLIIIAIDVKVPPAIPIGIPMPSVILALVAKS